MKCQLLSLHVRYHIGSYIQILLTFQQLYSQYRESMTIGYCKGCVTVMYRLNIDVLYPQLGVIYYSYLRHVCIIY